MWHYTNISSLHSILTNRSVWMTDIRFLNDSSEYIEGVSEFIEYLREFYDDISKKVSDAQKTIDYLNSLLLKEPDFNLSEDPIFIFSLSESDNLLSQWRAYGKYSIEFDNNYINDSFGCIHKCIYKKDDKINIVKEKGINAIIEIDREISQNCGQIGLKTFDIIESLSKLIASFKNEGFSEENEYRAIKSISEGDNTLNLEMKYRPKGELLIPYINFPISLDCIKGIQVGPIQNKQLAIESVTTFANKIEKGWQADGASAGIEYWIEIKSSGIPFRD